ncbi:MAG TPA: ParB/RepB/Spo0J family partition protein [Chitinophagaceae bacterium]|nr:ParB/RepB/Spo0J family partition protein [Chitinophagaceae bacterium]HNF71059.1 ParB/RepB/Spo0J family partition protein [Chitinophagaceae bacterium]
MSTKPNTKEQIGKGIGALLGNIKDEVSAFTKTPIAGDEVLVGSITRIPLNMIEVNPNQPRRTFEEGPLKELAESIRLHDIIQPITVVKLPNKKYQLISGERRYKASQIAGLHDIPAYIRSANDQEILEMGLLENLQREDLNAIEIGLAYKRLMTECHLTQEEVADRMKKERSTVTNYIRLLKLPPSIQVSVRNKELSMGHARALLGLEHIEQQLVVAKEIIEKELSVRATEELVKKVLGSKPKKETAPAGIPPAYKRIEDQIASHLSTKVILNRKKNGNGSITIEFYNDSDLERILDQMSI